jgi:hypothetical protein
MTGTKYSIQEFRMPELIVKYLIGKYVLISSLMTECPKTSLFGERNFCIITTVWKYQILWPTFFQGDRCANQSYVQPTSIWTLPYSLVSN